MCGIAGSINCVLTERDINQISHRGPDAQAIVEMPLGANKVYLGHTRLSIIELSEAGSQPMFTTCGNYCIVFNGEIYNHLELRKKLKGINFVGHSDTETILYYLREYGIEAVKDFNGIFAFAFIDKKQEKLYLVRDVFGVKPLYYYTNGDKLIFASEIKIIKNNSSYSKELDLTALNTFLTFRYNPSPQTLFSGINKLEAASYLEFTSSSKSKLYCYWSTPQKINFKVTEQEAVAEYKRLLEQSIKRQLLSDVPVGLFLSGGLDSAVLGHLMSKHCEYTLKTFTVGFHGKGNYNELDDARETARLLQSDHYDLFMNREQYMNFFYNSFFHTEEPIAEPTIPALYYVSQLASRHVKVVLSGQGADEPMAGYNRYKGEKILAKYQKLLSLLPLSLLSRVFPNNSSIDRGIYSSKFKDELERFIGIYTLFTPKMKEGLYKNGLSDLINDKQKSFFARHYNLADNAGGSLSKLLYVDLRTMLPDNLLLFNDKMTMANSIENRVPYLDIDLINFVESLPINLKLNGLVGKYIHRKAAEDWLPKSIINRKKRGFETPVGEWFEKDLANSLIDLVDSSNSFSNSYFDINFIKGMIHQHKSKKKDYQRHLFILLSLELWFKNFYQIETKELAPSVVTA
ncbi:asparagine synthase (glutamine-hydrolyzing) [Pontibacter amylolyticus]|uniref:asparagine synthase (glutamine-hydrolyzing) n=1 Tax=Pontibacter amylolyticus TaxID=1424080 RepID=A0ABQ1WFE6_9BACT|nr:asparagine synthase (glutamine-hydrolyzing) [Pontibacter amylolyticus]GGG28276.1 asparagine synthetase B [Pontibacter amylolyticus]